MATSQEQMVLMLDAHDRSALAAATAAAYRHMGEPLRQAVHDAEVVLDAAGAVDEDSATTTVVPDATAPTVDTIPSPLPPEPSHALAVHPLAPPPLDVVRQVLGGGLDTRTGPSYAAPAAPVDIQSSFSDSLISPEQHDDKPASCSMDDSNQSCYGSEFPHTLTDEDTSQTSNLAPEKEELLSLAAGMLGLTATSSPGDISLSVPESPAMVVGGTGLGAHSGGRRDSSGSCGSRLISALQKTHGISPSSSGTSRNPRVATRTDTPSRVRVHRSDSMDADIVDDIMSPTSPNTVMSGGSGLRGVNPGSVPPSMSSLSILKRPLTPIPLRGGARSPTSSYRSGASSPVHSTRASVISLEDLAALTAVKEEDHVFSMTIPDAVEEEEENGDKHSQVRVDTSQEEHDEEEEGLPEWYSTPTEVKPGLPSARVQAPAQAATGTVGGVAMGIDEALNDCITSPSSPGACAVLTVPNHNIAAGSKGRFMWSTPETLCGEATTAAATPVSNGVETTAAAAVAAEVTPPVSIASDDNRPHTGIPQLDDAPGLVEEVKEIKDQIALHGYVGRAAAMAGALVHTGHTMAQAANLAEGALDTSDVIDFVCARTNLSTPDTVPDILAAHRHPAPTTPANTPASITPPLRTAAVTPKATGASSPTTVFSVTTPPTTPKTASEMLQQVDRHVSFTMYTGEQPPITASLGSECKLPSDLPDHVQRPPPSAYRVIPIAEAGGFSYEVHGATAAFSPEKDGLSAQCILNPPEAANCSPAFHKPSGHAPSFPLESGAGYVKQKAVEEEYVDVVHCLPARLDSAMGGVCPASSAAVAAAHVVCTSMAPATAPPTPSAPPTAEVSVGDVLSEEVALP